MNATPRVSVVMPVYNRAAMAVEAARSLLAQTFADFELIVVDDASTDAGAETVAALDDARLRVLRLPENRGPAVARNTGIAAARGEYVAFLDSDDLALPQRLARQVAFLDANPALAMAGTWSAGMDAAGRRTGRRGRQPVHPADVQARLLFRCCITQSTVMARRDALGPAPYDPHLPTGEDYDLYLRFAARRALANLPEVLALSRRHPGQLSGRKAQTRAVHRHLHARELAALGMTPTAEDLDRHFLLTRKASWHRPDRVYLAWADAWLAELLDANARVRRYDPAALTRAADDVWLALLGRVRPRYAALRGAIRRRTLRAVLSSRPAQAR